MKKNEFSKKCVTVDQTNWIIINYFKSFQEQKKLFSLILMDIILTFFLFLKKLDSFISTFDYFQRGVDELFEVNCWNWFRSGLDLYLRANPPSSSLSPLYLYSCLLLPDHRVIYMNNSPSLTEVTYTQCLQVGNLARLHKSVFI